MEMAKKGNDPVHSSSSDRTMIKKEKFDAKTEAGDFNKVRAAPRAGGRGKAAEKGTVREKPVSEVQETFGPSVQKFLPVAHRQM